MFKLNKIVNIFILIILFFVILFLCSCTNSQENNVNNNKAEEIKWTKIDNNLKNDTPVLYDFLYGTLDWHTTKNIPSLYSNVVYMFAYSKNDDKLYVTGSFPSDDKSSDYIPPTYGIKPSIVENFENNNKNNILNNLNKVELKEEEKDYTFYWIWYDTFYSTGVRNGTPGFVSPENWCGINLPVRGQNNENTLINSLHENISKGVGIDTEYLRAKESTNMAKYGYNINDSFWDNKNFSSHYKCFKKDSKNNEYIVLTPSTQKLISSDNIYINTYLINGKVQPLDENGINEYLIKNGYENLESTLSHRNFSSSIK